MLFRYLRGRMYGAFLLGKQALCHQSPISMLTRSIHGGAELPGSMQCSFIETCAMAGPEVSLKAYYRETKAEQ